jgi:hypothetical protein
MLPIKTTIEDISTLGTYLKTQVGWVPLDRVRKALDSKYADNRKLEAQRRLGLIDRDGTNVKLSDRGRSYATSSDAATRAQIMQEALREMPLYKETVEWLHYSKVEDPTKTEIGNYWHDRHQDQLEGAKGAALTDAVIFFMRVAGEAGLGAFTRGAGARPDSYLKTDPDAIETFVTAKSAESVGNVGGEEGSAEQVTDSAVGEEGPVAATPVPTASSAVSFATSPAVHVNLEIHIAADATAGTVAEIFKNMRKYVLNDPADAAE